MRSWFRFWVALLVAGAALAACSGGRSGSTPPVSPAASKHTGSVTFVIKIPSTSGATSVRHAAGVRPAYISPATQSITISISGPTTVSQQANLTTGSPNCSGSPLVCTLTIPFLQPGNYEATLTTYDGANETGNVLSTAQSAAFEIVAGQDNSVALTMSGVPASATLVSGDGLTSVSGGTVTLYALGAHALVAEALDADGDVIVGPGAPTFNVSTPSGSLGATVSATSTTGSFTVTPPTTYSSSTTTFTVTPTFSGQSVTDGCAQAGADCTAATITVKMRPALYVANENGISGSITAYDLNGDPLSLPNGAFSNLDAPYGIAYDPVNQHLYVASYISSQIGVYDSYGSQQSVSGTFAGLDTPTDITYDTHNGMLYVTNTYGGEANTWSVTEYDGNGNEQTLADGAFSGLDYPTGITFGSDTNTLWVVNQVPGTIQQYDENGTTGANTVAGLNYPVKVFSDPNVTSAFGNLLYSESVENTCTPSTSCNYVHAYYGETGGTDFGGNWDGLDGPAAITADIYSDSCAPFGCLYVANLSGNSVTVYSFSGTEQTVTGSWSGVDEPYAITVVP